MGSRNAFNNGFSSTALPMPPSASASANDVPVNKRQTLATLEADIHTKTADPDLALEVDHMILDYLAYRAITATLASRKPQQSSSISLEHNVAMLDGFLAVFKAKHPAFEPDEQIRFRLLLLKFTSLFVRRLRRGITAPSSSALAALRDQNQRRAKSWIGNAERIPSGKYDMTSLDTELPIDRHILERNRGHVLNELGAAAEDEAYEDAFYGTGESLALLDILPAFMEMSAALNAIMNSNLTNQWMQHAGNLMLQACLEQYLVRGASGSDAIDEAFSWGYKADTTGDGSAFDHDNGESPNDSRLPTNHQMSEEINDMFEAEEDSATEVPGWAKVKSYYLEALLCPSSVTDMTTHLERIASDHSVCSFEGSTLALLDAMLETLPAPILVQLEKGALDGFTANETKKLLSDFGLAARWPLV